MTISSAPPVADIPTETRAPIWWRPTVLLYAILTLAMIVVVKVTLVSEGSISPVLQIYGLLVVSYLGSRAVYALRYRAVPAAAGDDMPTVAVVVPCFNEGAAVKKTVDSILSLDYPVDMLSIVVVDDGSTDDSWNYIREAATDGRVRAIRLAANSGKRAAMAAGIRAANVAEVVAFVDSDTLLDSMALRAAVAPLVQDASLAVGAVTGHAEVANSSATWLARLQQVRYFASFRLVKAAESVQRRVVCASGCFSVYRRSALLEVLPAWEAQRFLGQAATYGDDRALTTDLLRLGYDVLYQQNAVSYTSVPTQWPMFWKQQLRWKKSWTRESLRIIPVAARWSPIRSYPVYANIVMQIVGPLVLLYSILVRPLAGGSDPWLYLAGINAMAVLYGLMYAWCKRSAAWWPGAAYAILYTCVMSFQMYIAWWKLRDTDWGTRGDAGKLAEPSVAETIHGDGLRAVNVYAARLTSQAADHWARRYGIGVAAMAVLGLPLLILGWAI